MRKLLLTILAASALAVPAQAADMPLKVARQNLLVFPFTGSGVYWGGAVKGGVEQDSASGTFLGTALATGNANALGGSLGGTIGYMRSMGQGDKAIAFEASGYWSNVSATAPAVGANGMVVPASFGTRWSADQVVKVFGFDPFTLLGNLGFGAFPTLPTPPTLSNVPILPTGHRYWMLGVEEWGIRGNLFTATGTDVGVAFLLGAGTMNQIVDTTGKVTGAVLDTGAQVVFADKGVGISGLFAQGGGAPTFGALTSGRKYEVFAKVEW